MLYHSAVHSITLSFLISLFIWHLYLVFDSIHPLNATFYYLYSCRSLFGGQPVLHNSSQTHKSTSHQEAWFWEIAFACECVCVHAATCCRHCVPLFETDNYLIQKAHNNTISLSLTTTNYIMASCVLSKPNTVSTASEWENILHGVLKQDLVAVKKQPAEQSGRWRKLQRRKQR